MCPKLELNLQGQRPYRKLVRAAQLLVAWALTAAALAFGVYMIRKWALDRATAWCDRLPNCAEPHALVIWPPIFVGVVALIIWWMATVAAIMGAWGYATALRLPSHSLRRQAAN